jgi:hypothetical protein
VLAAPVADVLSGTAPLPDSAVTPVADVLSGTVVADATPVLSAPVADAVNGTALPDASSVLDAPVAAAVSGAAPLPDATSALTVPVGNDAVTGAASLPDAAPGAAGPITDAFNSVASPISDPVAAVAQPPAGGALTAPAGGASSLPFDDAFPINPATIAHVLASPETRLVIVGLFGAYAAGLASGVGMVDFAQPLLRSCTASVRLAFSPVRLVPCGRGASSPGSTLVSRVAASPAEVGPRHRGGGEAGPRAWFRPPVVAAGTLPPRIWSVPNSDNVVLRVVAAVLAALSAAIAGVGGHRVVRGRAGGTNAYRRDL